MVKILVAVLLCLAALAIGAVVSGLIAFRAGINHRKNLINLRSKDMFFVFTSSERHFTLYLFNVKIKKIKFEFTRI